MESICILDRTFPGGGGIVRVVKPSRYGRLSGNGTSATVVTAGVSVSGGLDSSVCTHGSECGKSLAIRSFDTAQPGDQSVYCPVDCQLLLESDLLQCPVFFAGIFVVAAPVGAGWLDDHYLP